MKISNLIKIALKNIIKNKTRSILTALGIIIGVLSVVIMVGIGNGTKESVNKQISSLGSNLFFILPGGSNNSRGVNRGSQTQSKLTLNDVDKLRKESIYIKNISPVISLNSQVIYNENNWYTSITGVSEKFNEIRELNLESGSFINLSDIIAKKNVAVIGYKIKNELFSDENVIGKNIRIGKHPFTIIGLLEQKGSSFGRDQDDVIYIPYTTAYYKLINTKYIGSIYISSYSDNNDEYIINDIRKILRESHKLTDKDSDDFSIGNQAEIAKTATQITGLLTLLLGSIAGISLLVGGIGIMNIMLVSVTERTREIGIRIAIGARRSDVLMQFLIEAVVLSIAGGVIGIFLSIVIGSLITGFTTIDVIIKYDIILISFLFSATIGTFFGWYPASKASKLNPIEALRYE